MTNPPGYLAYGINPDTGDAEPLPTTSSITGSVDVNNGAGAAAVNIQDGGNSITVDGTVAVSNTVTVAGTVTANAGTGDFNNASVDVTATTAPTSATLIGAVDNSGNLQAAAIKPLNVQVTGTDEGIIVNSVIHGLTTAGGGSYVDVKVTPSGALATDTTISGTPNINVSQFGGTNVATGTGTSGTGIPRVTVSNDSAVKIWDGSVIITVKSGSVNPGASDTALVVTPSPNMVGTPNTFGTSSPTGNALGSNASIFVGTTPASSTNPVPIFPADLYVAGASAQTATVNNILTNPSGTAATDLLGYRSGSVQVVSTATGGTFIFEGSNDNTNFQTIPVFSQLILTGTPISAAITATATSLIYTFPVPFRYIRLRIATTITGGSIQAFSKFSCNAWTPAVFQVAQNTNTNLLVGARVTGNAGANMDAAVGTLPTNNVASISVPTTGAGGAFSVGNAAGLTTLNIKASAGSLYGMSIVNKVANVTYIQTYNTAGTPTLGTSVISWIPVAASATVFIPPGSIALQNFATGIGIGAATTATGAAAPATAPDVVVYYK